MIKEFILIIYTLDLSETTTQSPSSSTVQPLNDDTKQQSMKYEEFRKRKASSRVTTLPSTSSKPKRSIPSKGNSTEKVKIQVGTNWTRLSTY